MILCQCAPNSKDGTNAYYENKYEKRTGQHGKIFGAIMKTLLKYKPRSFQKI
jgi:hypothetical protein